MQFAPPRRPPPRESIVPMINVVFLLLIFFLMTAEIAPPDPVDVALPLGSGAETTRDPDTLFAAADGTLALGVVRGDAALAGVAGREQVTLRADARLDGAALAALLRRLAEAGVGRVTLMAEGR
jgi:biopolymer transport protein ExbD